MHSALTSLVGCGVQMSLISGSHSASIQGSKQFVDTSDDALAVHLSFGSGVPDSCGVPSQVSVVAPCGHRPAYPSMHADNKV